MSTPRVDCAALRRLAAQAARIGGQTARSAFGGALEVWTKPDASDVSHADLAAEQAVVDAIRAQRPDDAFLTEESDARPPLDGPGAAQVTWIIDPIDGTRNFVRGIPLFGCSVAAMVDGMPVAGAIYDPNLDAMYAADAGQAGLLLNDAPSPPRKLDPRPRRPLIAIPSSLEALFWNDASRSPSETGALARAGIARRPGAALPPDEPVVASPQIDALLTRCLRRGVVRNLGCSTLHLAWLAAARLDAAVFTQAKLWDLAAGWMLLSAAGCAMTDLSGAPLFPLRAYAGTDMPALAAWPPHHAGLLAS